MAEAERHARDFGCHSAFVDTFTLQGPEFYPKLGYREYARLDYPPDHNRIFFRKNFDRPSLLSSIYSVTDSTDRKHAKLPVANDR
jgi:hypothetical protein